MTGRPNGGARRRQAAGFTLLELIIVISIIVILATITLPMVQKSLQQARESTLVADLYEMRGSIQNFTRDKGRSPQSLEELVTAEYLRNIPPDPITRESNWTVVMEADPLSTDGAQGVKDVRSSAEGVGLDGKAYSEY